MAIKITDQSYKCSICNKTYKTAIQADNCRDAHEVIYVPILKSDLNLLINFIYSKDESLITSTLMDTLRKYLRK